MASKVRYQVLVRRENIMSKYLNTAISAVIFNGLLCVPAVAQSDPYLGQIATFTFNFCPVGWATLNGQLLPISQNVALFSLLGTTYGGDGTTTFALPTARVVPTLTEGATLMQCIATVGIYPSHN
jgi:microcystin-dependent protein